MLIKKRILIAARWPVGGIRTYFRYIYSNKVFNEYSFTFIAPNSGDLKDFLDTYIKDLDYKFIETDNSTIDLFKKSLAELKKEKYDVIHSHGFTAAFAMVPVSKLMGIPHLMTAHDVFQTRQFEGNKGKIKKAIMSIAFRTIDQIHTVSVDGTDNLLDFFPKLKNEKITPILHGVDTEYFYKAAAFDLKSELNKDNIYVIGFFGRFMSQKGFRFLVDAVQKIINNASPDAIKPMVLTFGWGGFVREDYEYVEEKGLKDYFKMMPHTDNMAASLKGVDMVAMPSLWEACGLLGMEALTAGVPIVGTTCIGLREVLEGSPAQMVEPRSSDSLAQAIEEEMKNDRRAEFEEYAKIAKKRFSLERPAQELKKLYDRMA